MPASIEFSIELFVCLLGKRRARCWYYAWVLCGRAGASGEEASVFGCGTACGLVHCVEIDEVSDGCELIWSGVCGGKSMKRTVRAVC